MHELNAQSLSIYNNLIQILQDVAFEKQVKANKTKDPQASNTIVRFHDDDRLPERQARTRFVKLKKARLPAFNTNKTPQWSHLRYPQNMIAISTTFKPPKVSNRHFLYRFNRLH